jgi:site-specific DNA-cytosine methylase
MIPLIGPYRMACDRLEETEGIQFEQKAYVTWNGFADNEQHLIHNYPEMKDVKHVLEKPQHTVEEYRDIIYERNIPTTDIVAAVPPCAGLSMLNSSTKKDSTRSRGANAAQNNWMLEVVKYFLASGSKVLVLENAPALATRSGMGVLNKAINIVKEAGLSDQYKLNVIKTSTINHGLPQNRRRTFLYVYRADSHYKFKNLVRKFEPIETFLGDGEDFSTDPEDVYRYTNTEDVWFKFMEQNDLFPELERRKKDIKFGRCLNATPVIVELQKEGKIDFTGFPRIKKFIDHVVNKLSMGKGYWDGGPVLFNGSVNAVISKNMGRIIHPTHLKRFLTRREMCDLMGIPRSFEVVNISRNICHITQNVPTHTAADSLLWAIGIARGDERFAEKWEGDLSKNLLLLLQDNGKGDLERNLFEFTGYSYRRV